MRCGTSARRSFTSAELTCSRSRNYVVTPGLPRRLDISTSTPPTSKMPGSPDNAESPTDGKDWLNEVESTPDRGQPRHLEGQRVAADAGRARPGGQRRQDVGL